MRRLDASRHLAGTGTALPPPAMAQESMIVVGQSAAFTGPAAQLGTQPQKDARIAFDAIDATGGVSFSGLSVNCISRDPVASHFVDLYLLTGDGKVSR